MNGATFISVRDVMNHEPECIEGLATIEEALQRMRTRGISSLVVNRRDAQDEFGLLLIADIAREVIGKNRPPARTNVYEIATKPAPALNAEMHIKYAIRHMARFDITHALALSGRDLAGIVTLRDMVLHLVE